MAAPNYMKTNTVLIACCLFVQSVCSQTEEPSTYSCTDLKTGAEHFEDYKRTSSTKKSPRCSLSKDRNGAVSLLYIGQQYSSNCTHILASTGCAKSFNPQDIPAGKVYRASALGTNIIKAMGGILFFGVKPCIVKCPGQEMVSQIMSWPCNSKHDSVHIKYYVKDGTGSVGCCGTTCYDHVPYKEGCYRIGVHSLNTQCPGMIRGERFCSTDLVGNVVEVKLPFPDHIHVQNSLRSGFEWCNPTCHVKVVGTTTISCPNGERRIFDENTVTHDCPFHDKGYFFRVVCRFTDRPYWFYSLLLWLLGGLLLSKLILYGFLTTLCILGKTVIKTRGIFLGSVCTYCKVRMHTKYHNFRHLACSLGDCAYCKKSFPLTILPKHASLCPEKDRCDMEDNDVAMYKEGWLSVRKLVSTGFRIVRPLSKCLYLILLVVLFLGVAADDTVGYNDEWELLKTKLEGCSEGCYWEEGDCRCNHRGLLSLPANFDFKSDWLGADVNFLTEPPLSKQSTLTWQAHTVSNGKLKSSGFGHGELVLSPKSSLQWLITADGAHERTISVVVIDVTDIYDTTFRYFTGDRTLETSMSGQCTGNCDSQCACKDQLCAVQNWTHFSNWRCNPGWCWSIGDGCICCKTQVRAYYQNFLFSAWDVRRSSTEAFICFYIDHSLNKCVATSGDDEFEVGGLKFKLSRFMKSDKPLESNLLVQHGPKGAPSFTGLMLAHERRFCPVQSCTEGPLGDIQFFSQKDVLDRKGWMSWSGSEIYYSCHPGHWPDCSVRGLVQHNEEAFENAQNAGTMEKFHFHTFKVNYDETSVPSLSIKARGPTSSSVTVSLTGLGLLMESTSATFDDITLHIISCSGCYSCKTGIKCNIEASSTEEKIFHLITNNSDIVVTDSGLIASSEVKILQVTAATNVNIKQITLCIKENGEICDTAVVILNRPVPVKLETRTTLLSTSDSGGYFGEGFFSLGGRITSFLASFGSIAKGVFLILTFIGISLIVAWLISKLVNSRKIEKLTRSEYEKLLKESQEFLLRKSS